MEHHHQNFNRITFNPEKCFGKPCIRGYRMPVATLLGYMGGGMSIAQILKEWPELEKEDILQALSYASLEAEERFIPARP